MRRAFFDTNVLVFCIDARDATKQRVAVECWQRELAAGTAVISTQVMAEFGSVLHRRFMAIAPWGDVRSELDRLAATTVVLLRPADIVAAVERCARLKVAWYDALILQAAISGDCSVLYSDAFQHGRTYDGVQVINPFHELPESPRLPPRLPLRRVRTQPAARATKRKKK